MGGASGGPRAVSGDVLAWVWGHQRAGDELSNVRMGRVDDTGGGRCAEVVWLGVDGGGVDVVAVLIELLDEERGRVERTDSGRKERPDRLSVSSSASGQPRRKNPVRLARVGRRDDRPDASSLRPDALDEKSAARSDEAGCEAFSIRAGILERGRTSGTLGL